MKKRFAALVLCALLLCAAVLCAAPVPAAAAALGDVDGNGQLSAADARLALRAAVKLEKLTAAQFTAADADGNGQLSAADARKILRAAVKLETLTKTAEIIITKSNFEKEVLQSKKPVLLDFWATWCGPCRDFAPVLEQFAEKHPEIKVGKVDIDEQPELAAMHNITAIPTIAIYKDGKLTYQNIGGRSLEALEALFAEPDKRALTSADFEKEVLRYSGTVVLDFWAPWCGPCKDFAPVLEQFAEKHPEIKVRKINIDDEPALAEMHNITAIPTIAIYKNGKLVYQDIGGRSLEALEALVK